MIFKWKLLVLFSFCFVFQKTSAQINENLGVWYAYNLKTNIQENFTISVDLQTRYNTNKQQLIRGVIGKKLKNNFNLGIGYGYFNNQRPGPIVIYENRIFQELNYKHKGLAVLNFKHRFRVEERFMSHKNFFMRYRYAIAIRCNLFYENNKTSVLNLLLANEVFLNSEISREDQSDLASFDRNRIFFGLEYNFEKKFTFQIAYMDQHLETNNAAQLVLKLVHKI